MEALCYYSDLVNQMYLLEIEKEVATGETQVAAVSSAKELPQTWFARLNDWLTKVHHWFSVPLEAEAQEDYQEGRMPLYWKGY